MDPQRVIHAGDIGHDVFHAYFKQHFFPCEETSIQKDAGDWKGMVRCFQSKSNVPVDLVLLGDSHAEHLFLGLAEALPQLNVAFYVKGALPVLDAPEFKVIFKQVLANTHIRSVLITANWDDKLKKPGSNTTLVTNLDRTVKALQDKGLQVYVMPDLPRFDFDPQRCKFQRPLTKSTQCDEPLNNYTIQQQRYMTALKEVKRQNPGIQLMAVSAMMCGDNVCSMTHNGRVLYRDNNHLNIPGSQYVGTQLVQKYPSLALAGR